MGWILGLALGVGALLAWRFRRARRIEATVESPAGPTTTYRIRGPVELRNECDGDGLPERIQIRAVLRDGKRTAVEARARVSLVPGSAGEDDAPDLVGEYSLEVEWRGERPPAFWDPPRAARIDGSDVCESIACGGQTRCFDLAGRPRRIDLTGPDMEFPVRVACICVPQ